MAWKFGLLLLSPQVYVYASVCICIGSHDCRYIRVAGRAAFLRPARTIERCQERAGEKRVSKYIHGAIIKQSSHVFPAI